MSDILRYAQDIFNTEIKAIQEVRDNLDEQFEEAIRLLIMTKGKVIVTGMGKSGRIGEKITATLSSTGTPAAYLHPSEAAHGDLGIISKGDILLTIGKSGESDEIINILPAIKKVGLKIISLVGNKKSRVAQMSDVVLNIHISEEACDLNLAPTSSTTASLVMGDALAVVLMKLKKFQSKDFALFHPAGQLGKRLLFNVADVMRKGDELPTIQQNDTSKNLIYLVSKYGLGAIGVCNSSQQFVGIITDGDLRRALESYNEKFFNTDIQKFMTTNPITVSPTQSAYEALILMEKKRTISHLPVLEGEKYIGLLCLHDLVKMGL